MASNKKYWRSFQELQDNSVTEQLAAKEFAQEVPVEEFLNDSNAMENTTTSRRDFLKILGFSTAAVTLASCEAPIIKSIPYVVKPEDITPGVANYYASSFYNGMDYANVLIKTREGRPIKVEANKTAKHFNTTSARAQASVLSLYDSDKIKEPQLANNNKKEVISWEALDKLVVKKLNNLAGKKAVLLTPSLPSPTTKKLIQEFQTKYPTAQHVVFDANDCSYALDAAEEVYGQRALPIYDLKQSKLIVSFNADFLVDYNGGGMESDYAAARKPGKGMMRHIQVESNLSLTGSNADTRMPVKQTQAYKILAEVYNALSGGATTNKQAAKLVKEIQQHGSKAVVLADGNKEAHVLAHTINQLIGSEVIVKDKVLLLKESNNTKFKQFLADANAGQVGVLISYQANPAYASSSAKEFAKALQKIDFSLALSEKEDETATLMNAIAPVPHWLESWNDLNPKTGVYSLQQPTIQKIFNSRQFQDSLLQWAKAPEPTVEANTTIAGPEANPNQQELPMPKPSFRQKISEYHQYLKENWEQNILPQVGISDFNQALYEGCLESSETTTINADTSKAASAAQQLANQQSTDWEMQLYTKVSVGDGTEANNPWLQEMPDPITRTSWDNYLTLNPLDANKLSIDITNNANVFNGRMQFNGEYVDLEANGVKLQQVPVFIQPGQALGTVGLALGYGRTKAGKVANGVGVNAYPFHKNSLSVANLKITKTNTSDTHEFACMQMQNTLMGRYEIAREATLEDFISKPKQEWNEAAVMPTWRGDSPVGEVDLWRSFDRTDGPHFNLSIDLNSCTGCGACVIACQAENNVPVVGKKEIRMSRDMYWLRIDRYYSDSIQETDPDKYPYTQKEALLDETRNEPSQYKELIKPAAKNPDVIFQPMMCQHCNHAPCETVCPVAATSHGKQGQNQMAYNRCVGTRYCANNCPYKVRRFNWLNYANNDKFDYHMNNDLGRMVLNPDVAVRTRGVMEKCSMCIQMTQAQILKAKTEGRRLKDEEVQTACANACPSGSIKFGDINDAESEVSTLKKDERTYHVLEEIGTKPNVFYHVKVRNT